MKRVISVVVAACLVLCLAACKSAENTVGSGGITSVTPSQNGNFKTVSLLYSYSDTFNPYTAKTAANRELSALLYDSLVKTDNSFEPILVLAKQAKIDGTVCTVTLNDATFTDGSAVTSEDVVYSYNLAKECVRFSGNFYEIVSVEASNTKTVVFNLSQHDPYFLNLLDFPIIKSGTSGITNDDGREVAPIGCGRYVLSDDQLSFKLNDGYYGKKGAIKKINLINSPDAVSTAHYVEIGATYAYYNDDGDIVRMSGKKTDVNLNRFVYIGINSAYGSLATKEMRYAISSALDRETICRTAYYNNAVSANGFFNPAFNPTKAVQTIESKPNFKITVENLAKIGYNNMNADGFYANSSGNNPAFSLLVNSENASRVAAAELVASQCEAAGIKINVVKCTYSQYAERLKNGDFQLYLGEVQVLDNMDLSAMVINGGSAAYGVGTQHGATDTATDQPNTAEDSAENTVPATSANEAIYRSYREGVCGISDVASVLLTEMPQIPICYLNGNLFYDSEITGGIESSSSDIYLTIQNYEF